MRILVLCASLPYPPASGGALRTYGFLQGLSAHQVTLLAFDDSTTPPENTPLAQWCERIVTLPPPRRTRLNRLRDLLFTRQPDIAKRFYSLEFEQKLRHLLRETQFDVIQFEAIEIVLYLPLVKALQPDAKLVFDTFNAEYQLQYVIYTIDRQETRRWLAALYSLVQARRIERYERQMCELADAVIAVSPEDAEALRQFRADGCVHVVPSGIFVDEYTKPAQHLTLKPNALVFTGKMDYRPNVDAVLWFVDEVMPIIQQQIEDVYLYVVGQQPHPRLDSLRARTDVTLTGWVDSVQPYLHAADVYIAPLRMGSGTRLKLLEAMACGCAITATSTAAAGMLPQTKAVMRIADDAEAFAEAVVHLLLDVEARKAAGETARENVRAHYDWSVLLPRLTRVYEELGIG